jgi:hypothetical protein
MLDGLPRNFRLHVHRITHGKSTEPKAFLLRGAHAIQSKFAGVAAELMKVDGGSYERSKTE